jgi:hypothetical protein
MATEHCKSCGGLKPRPRLEVYRTITIWVLAGYLSYIIGSPIASAIQTYCQDREREVYGPNLRPVELTDGNRDIHWCRYFVP